MTFVLFVISVAVMEAILAYDRSKQRRRKRADPQASLQPVDDPDPAQRVQELLSLGRALQNCAYDEVKAEDPERPSTAPIVR